MLIYFIDDFSEYLLDRCAAVYLFPGTKNLFVDKGLKA